MRNEMGCAVVAKGDAVFERVESSLASWLCDQSGGNYLEIEIVGIGLTQRMREWLVRDCVRERVAIPYEATSMVDELRAAQFVPGRGAWTWCRLWMDASDGVLHQECDWMREPDFGPGAAGAGEYAIELDIYPRDPECVPGWLAERAAAYEKRKERNARRREARRRKREQERGG
ncbi:hypothetical protein [Actinomyces procaprae]|uniref:hypothetical protein n=1 Tax=Actinomyces procaprae TaxID=2560010 RepID=UPI001F010731|nr:hypothetical protein [Actinomyces procaprae]